MSDALDATYQRLVERLPDHTDPQGYSYVTYEDVTDRLNQVLGPFSWSFKVKEWGIRETWSTGEHPDEQIWCIGQLTVPGEDGRHVVREQFGAALLQRKKLVEKVPQGEGMKPVEVTKKGDVNDLANDIKAAATDAFKKCAQSLGVGLYLAQERTAKRENQNQRRQRPAQPQRPASQPATSASQPRDTRPVEQGQPVGKPVEQVAAPKPADDRTNTPEAFWCQECGGVIPSAGVMVNGRQFTRHAFAAEMQKRFHRTLCAPCARRMVQETLAV